MRVAAAFDAAGPSSLRLLSVASASVKARLCRLA